MTWESKFRRPRCAGLDTAGAETDGGHGLTSGPAYLDR